ncbi:MAG: uridine kinase [Micromonosporaceae bacterium]
MPIRPISPEALVHELADRVVASPNRWTRVAVDGADAAGPGLLADEVAAAVRVRGRAVVRVRAEDHLRPASLRFERGRDDPDSFYDDWLDEAGLRREVLDPLGPHGDGRVRVRRHDPLTDRATRDEFTPVPAGGALLLSGGLLLGRGLPLELTVHLHLSPAALARRTPAALAWTLPAYARYAEEVGPAAIADVVVRLDDPRHPALVDAE